MKVILSWASQRKPRIQKCRSIARPLNQSSRLGRVATFCLKNLKLSSFCRLHVRALESPLCGNRCRPWLTSKASCFSTKEDPHWNGPVGWFLAMISDAKSQMINWIGPSKIISRWRTTKHLNCQEKTQTRCSVSWLTMLSKKVGLSNPTRSEWFILTKTTHPMEESCHKLMPSTPRWTEQRISNIPSFTWFQK